MLELFNLFILPGKRTNGEGRFNGYAESAAV